jgi:broad specificity phosphatase PhoE
MTRVLLIRHGETPWNREMRWQGHADVPLSDAGRRQAERLAEYLRRRLRPIDALYSSDLRRASETARALSAVLGLDLRLEPAWREIEVGRWTGYRREEIREKFADEWRRIAEGEDLPRGGGETFTAFSARICAALDELRRRHDDATVAVVTHGGVIRAALLHALGLPWMRLREVSAVANTAINEIAWRDSGWIVTERDHVAHLEEMSV